MGKPLFSPTIWFSIIRFGSVRILKLRYSVYLVFTRFGRTLQVVINEASIPP